MEKYEKYVRGSYSIQQPPPLPLFQHRGHITNPTSHQPSSINQPLQPSPSLPTYTRTTQPLFLIHLHLIFEPKIL